ncbi:MAG: hypothetical protein AAGF25_11120 [Pseudomonadota bacterium]
MWLEMCAAAIARLIKLGVVSMRYLFFSMILLSFPSALVAEVVVCNEHGAVVTRDDGTIFYLGKSCDAAIEGGGTGRWFNAASFLAVLIGDSFETSQGYQIFSEIPCLDFCQSPNDF